MTETKFTKELLREAMKEMLKADPPKDIYWFVSEGVRGRCEVHDFMKPLPKKTLRKL